MFSSYTSVKAKANCSKCVFRTSPSEFIVPYDQYMESIKKSYTIGMRFKMRFEGEEAPEQRYKICIDWSLPSIISNSVSLSFLMKFLYGNLWMILILMF